MLILKAIWGFFIDIAQTLLLAAAVFLVTYIFLFRPFEVSGESMMPNFQDKEYILTNIISLRFEKPKLGDVIVFKAPTDNEKDFIKRVIGTPGDTVMVQNGDVFVNGKMLDQSAFLDSSVKTYGGAFLKDGQKITVPPNSYFVMGDNRPNSSDSREWGFVSFDAVIGKSFFVYLPVNEMGLVKNPYVN